MFRLFMLSLYSDPTVQLYKSRGAFMKKGEKFTIEDGVLICVPAHSISYHIIPLVRDNWKEVCDMSRPVCRTSTAGKLVFMEWQC